MRKLVVSLPEGKSYPVLVGKSLFDAEEWFESISFPSRKGVLLTNTTLDKLHAEKVLSFFKAKNFLVEKVVIPDGEEYKNLKTVEVLYHELVKLNVDRKSFLLAFGGGVVTDITGFVASTFLRGIAYFQVPTSLLAQVDSSIGGKTGVNLEEGKNLVGTFYQPKGVFIDLSFLGTLPEREYREGLSEVLKAAFLAGGAFLQFMKNHKEALKRKELDILEETVTHAVDFKRKIVEADEKESGLRSILNYGHTLGHALEKTLGYGNIRHGEAVAIGMVGESLLSWKVGIGKKEVFEEQKKLLEELGLPICLGCTLDQRVCLTALHRDKKKERGKIRFVFLEDFGRPKWGIEVDDEEIDWVLCLLEKGEYP